MKLPEKLIVELKIGWKINEKGLFMTTESPKKVNKFIKKFGKLCEKYNIKCDIECNVR